MADEDQGAVEPGAVAAVDMGCGHLRAARALARWLAECGLPGPGAACADAVMSSPSRTPRRVAQLLAAAA